MSDQEKALQLIESQPWFHPKLGKLIACYILGKYKAIERVHPLLVAQLVIKHFPQDYPETILRGIYV